MNWLVFPFCAIAFLCSSSLIAKLHKMEVVSGEAILSSSSNGSIIRSGEKTILQWDGFSIDLGESVEFKQLDRHSAVLNRVVGGSETALLGSLLSNGAVYILNPNGVLIGPQARIETNGFLASTLDVLDSAFLEGNALLFSGDALGTVMNLGSIHCQEGDIALIGRTVKNRGNLQATNGSVALAAGMEILLQPHEDQKVFIRPALTDSPMTEGTLLEHSGMISALCAELKTGGSPYAKAIQSTGIIQANKVTEKEGKIYLVARQGTTEVSGSLIACNSEGFGGDIQVLGEKVHLMEQAEIDVSGKTGGGTVLVGGDYQGKNDAIANASHVWMGPSVKIEANSLESGDGGRVILWSEQNTIAHGIIRAEGGKERGNGGFVEISSRNYLVPNSSVSTLAPKGKNGTLLLDPCAVTLSASADANNSYAAPNYTFSSTTSTINIANLITNLSSSNVVIDATVSGSAGSGSITVAAPITGAGGGSSGESWTNNNLTLTGGSGITVNASSAISWAGTGTLSMTTDSGPITVGSAITNTGGSSPFTAISMTAVVGSGANSSPAIGLSASVSSVNGNITLNGTSSSNATSANGVSITSGGNISTASGDISVTGNVPSGATGTCVGVLLSQSNAITSSTGNITLSGSSSATGSGSHGVSITQSWVTGTSGDLTFRNCSGGSGSTSRGVNSAASVTTSGNVIATESIVSGANSGAGFQISSGFTTNGIGKSIQITASATNTNNSVGNGIFITSNTLSTSGGGSIILNGTGAPSTLTGSSSGISIVGVAKVSTATGGGDISLVGVGRGSASASHGILLVSDNPIISSTGNIRVSGSTSSSGIGCYGVRITGNWDTGTTGDLTFYDCQGGTSTSGYGVNIESSGSVTTQGNIVGTNLIGRGGAGLFLQGILTTSGLGKTIQIAASSTSSSGIQISRTTMSTTGGGSIQINGTGGVVFNVGGVGQDAQVSTVVGGGDISITGTGRSASSSSGITLNRSCVVSSTGNITLDGTAGGLGTQGINLTGTQNFNTTTSGTVTFLVPSGQDVSLGANVTTNGGKIVVSGPVSFTGSLTIDTTNGGISPDGNDMTLVSNITGPGSGVQGLTLQCGNQGALSIGGDVNLQGSNGSAGGTFSVNAGGGVNLSGQVLTQGGSASPGTGGNGGDVTLTASSGAISMHNINASGGSGTVANGNGGNITITPATTLTSQGYPVGLVTLNQDLSSANDGNLVSRGAIGGQITISANRPAPSTVATIVSSLSGNNVLIAADTFSMGSYEAMTVLGDLTIQASTLTLSDLVVLNNLSISANIVNLLLHDSFFILSNEGALYRNPSLHFLSGNTYSQTGTLVPSGPLKATSLGLSPSQFRPLLIYNPILNFDNTPRYPIGFYQFVIANAQLSDLLNWLQSDSTPSRLPMTCVIDAKHDRTCNITKPRFETFIIETRDIE